MSETPRTDEAEIWLDILPTFQMSYKKALDLSRQIERELAEANARIVQLERALRNAMAEYYLELHGEYPSDVELERILKSRMKLAKEAMDGK